MEGNELGARKILRNHQHYCFCDEYHHICGLVDPKDKTSIKKVTANFAEFSH